MAESTAVKTRVRLSQETKAIVGVGAAVIAVFVTVALSLNNRITAEARSLNDRITAERNALAAQMRAEHAEMRAEHAEIRQTMQQILQEILRLHTSRP